MKKLFCLLLAVCVIPVFAWAETDLSSMSFDQLLALRSALNAEIISRPEWKEVIVPAGTWIVGRDIPAGSYSVSSASGELARFECNSAEGKDIEYIWLKKGKQLGRVDLVDGYIVLLTDAVIFAPPLSLGF